MAEACPLIPPAGVCTSRDAVEKLVNSPIEEIVITDSIPLPADKQHAKIKILSVAPLLAEAIRRVHEDRSVSELFK